MGPGPSKRGFATVQALAYGPNLIALRPAQPPVASGHAVDEKVFDGSYPLKGDTWEFANCAVPFAPFDGDCDGDRDLRDIAAFQQCFSPGVPAEPDCQTFDSAGDEGADLSDRAIMRGELAGPMPPPR